MTLSGLPFRSRLPSGRLFVSLDVLQPVADGASEFEEAWSASEPAPALQSTGADMPTGGEFA